MKNFQFDDDAPKVRLCEHSECDEIGEFRAPKSRSDIRSYLWFCLAHVREYNRAWNYFQGMSQDEIEAYRHSSNTWHRPTWVMGVNGTSDPVAATFEKLQEDLGLFQGSGHFSETKTKGPVRREVSAPVRKALAELELSSMASATEVKLRYKEMAKRFHPDLNGGSKSAEERLKDINLAYSFLAAAGFA